MFLAQIEAQETVDVQRGTPPVVKGRVYIRELEGASNPIEGVKLRQLVANSAV